MKRHDWLWMSLAYLAIRLPFLTALPVFADEAIYIRWAQLIQDDAHRYLFFSMADGKPPLFLWLLSPVLRFFPDPLWAGRFLSVLIGLATLWVVVKIVQIFSAKRDVALITGAAMILLPFWFFMHRMALMDGLLTLLISLSFLFALKIASNTSRSTSKTYLNVLFLGFSYGAALATKTPALFAIPLIALVPILFPWVLEKKIEKKKYFTTLFWVGFGGLIGCLLFLTLRVSPLFGALFSRSSDFTFTFQELLRGEWRYVFLHSIPRNLEWIMQYLTPVWMVGALAGLFLRQSRKTVLFFLLCSVLFFIPLTLFGRVLWPRYFLPAAVFLTIAGAFGIGELLRQLQYRLFTKILIGFALIRALLFIVPSYVNVAAIPFVPSDRSQYLEEWSAGFGNKQVWDYIKQERQITPTGNHIIVLTEGSFGTLPDGLQMYLHSQPIPNVEIHGIGVNVRQLPQEYLKRARTDQVYYMVNSHRFGVEKQDNLEKVMEISRPNNAPKLYLFRVKP